MLFTKLGILLIGFAQASLLPYAIRKALKHVKLDLEKYTLSFLSNKSLYGQKLVKGYKWMLIATALLTYAYFWLLTEYYDLGEHDKLMRYIDIGFASLALLAFVPHNLKPYSLKSFAPSLQRFLHNVLAVVVFLSLPALIITFQVIIIPEIKFLGISGLAIIGVTIFAVILSILKNGVNGATELLFINGIGLWTIFVTIVTFVSWQLTIMFSIRCVIHFAIVCRTDKKNFILIKQFPFTSWTVWEMPTVQLPKSYKCSNRM